MAKRRRNKKKKTNRIDLEVAALIVISIVLAILIYTQSGSLGKILTSMLGGLVGWIKYLIPVGTFAVAIYLVYDDKSYLSSKLIKYILLLLSIAIVLSIFQHSNGNLNFSNEYWSVVQQSYTMGERNIGGGAIGTMLAIPLVNLLGPLGAIIFAIGIAVIFLVLVFGFRPADLLSRAVQKYDERQEEREAEKEALREARKQERLERKKAKTEEQEGNKKKSAFAILEDDDQMSINIKGIERKYEQDEDLIPIKGKNSLNLEEPVQKPEIDNGLFKQEEEQKEDKTKQVLQLEHTITVEDENYEFPPLDLMAPGKGSSKAGKKSITDTAARLQKTLYSFGVSAKVENVSVGPAITRYELKPAEGVRVSKIANLADDIALNLAAESIRIEAPIPGKQAVGIEVPNKEKEMVPLRDIIDTEKFRGEKSKLSFALGKDVAGDEVVTDISKMPHVLIAGSTGSGKSVCINTLITSIIYKAKPSEVKLVMVDPKVVELSVYNGIPHLLIPVVTDPKKAAGALAWAVQEMVNRYSLFAEKGVRDIKGYNSILEEGETGEKLPQIVIIIDELADLMMVAPKDVEDAICRLAQMARAAGMHLVIATQRPSVDVITGIIKANIPSRIAFAVSSQVDSRTILDMVGAEKLLGKGDMLFYPAGASKPTRIQGAFVSDKEVESIVEFLKAESEVTYNEDILESIEKANKTDKDLEDDASDDDTDPFLMDAIDTVVETGQASTSFIQRRFKVGYARAGRIMDQMEQRGVISGYEGSKPRQVLWSKETLAELKMAKPVAPVQGVQEVQTNVET